MNDKDILNEALEHQIFMTNAYNACAYESVTPKLHDELINILNQEHTMLADITSELVKRGWRGEHPATSCDIEIVKNEFLKKS